MQNNKLPKFILLFILLCSINLKAQEWTRIHPFEVIEPLADLYIDEADFGWAVGAKGTILNTTDAGGNWTLIETSIEEDLNFIEFLPNSNGMTAFTGGGELYQTTDGGQSWTLFEAETGGGFYRSLFLISATEYFTFKSSGQIYRTTDAGQNWELISSDFSAIVSFVEFTDAMNGWALDLDGLLHFTTDGGDSWDQTDPTVFEGGSMIRFATPIVGYIASNKDLYKSMDGGQSWALWNENAFSAALFAFEVVNEDILYGTRGIRVSSTQDGGENWNFNNPFNYGDLGNVHALENGKVWVASNYLTVGFSEDFGEEWMDQIPGDKISLRTISFHEDSGKGIIGGSFGEYFLLDALDVNLALYDYQGGTFLGSLWTSENDVWLSGSGFVIHSADAGLTWESSISSGGTPAFYGLSQPVGGPLWTVNSDGVIYHTDNNGANWETDTLVDASPRDITFVDANTGYIVGQSNLILKTTDGGETWESKDSPISKNWGKVFFNNQTNKGWIFENAFSNEYIFTNDGGETWEVGTLPVATFYNDLYINDFRMVLVGGSTVGGHIFVSENEGETWVLNKVENSPYRGVAGVDYGAILNTYVIGGGGNIEVNELIFESVSNPKTAAFGIYPNPGKDQITFDLPQENTLQIRIYTQEGKLLHQSLIPGGQQTMLVSNLSPGLYFIEIQGQTILQTQKWIKTY